MEHGIVAMTSSATQRDRVHRLVDDVPEDQLPRVEHLLATIISGGTGEDAGHGRPWPASRVVGLAASDRPPPTDDEVRRMLEERRIEKYG